MKESESMKKKYIIIIILILLIISIIILKTIKHKNEIIKINPIDKDICDYKPHLYYEENGRKVYSYCLDKIEIKEGNSFISLKDYFNNHTIKDFEKRFENGISYDDGGTTVYRDGGTKKILKENTTVLICRTLEGNNDIYIGNKDMDYKHNFCKADNTTTTYRFKVLDINEYKGQQYTEDGTPFIPSSSYEALLENDSGHKEKVIINYLTTIPIKNRRYDFEFKIPEELKNIDLNNNFSELFKKAYLVEIRDIENNYINSKLITKLNKTNKIIIKNNNEEIGSINNKDTINKILDIISNSSKKGNVFNCDGTNLEFEFYNNKSLIDKMKVWTHNERIMFDSLQSNGCNYYTVPETKATLKKIIEENTNLKFYTIYDDTETCATALEKIYEDEKYEYLFNCIKSNNVFIEFQTTNEKLTLKDALNKKLITPETIIKDYPDLLMKRSKSN